VDVSRAARDELRGRVAAPSRDGAPAALPITRPDGELIGILALGRRLAHAPAGPAEDAISRSLARGLASALRNAETYVALRRAQHELAETERITAMGALAGGLAHEIKNPLASLKMGLHLLERDGVDAQRLRRIQWDLRRIDDLVSGLLHYTNDGESEGPEVLDLRLIARACVDDLRSLASTRGVRIVELYPAENAIAVAGRSRLRLVISNLLRNALDAVSENGRVEVSIRLDPSHLELLVRDTGSGIPAGDREHVFALGFSTKPQGTGLGLAFARREIDRLHGHIEVVPGEDRGTTLRVVLPRLMYST
jgi:signal transduction histidine kinase